MLDMSQLDAVYSHLWAAHTDEFALLDRSLAPRSWTLLFNIAAEAGLGPHSLVADVGCGRGNHCIELAERFECRAIGIDIVFQPLRNTLLERTARSTIEFIQGDI